jgi:lipopolysaccharide transport system permease protein
VDNSLIVIKPDSRWRLLDFGELLRYRDLLYFLVVRGIRARYAQSVLGVGWAIIQPLFSTIIFTIVFGRLAKISSDGVPYFLFSLSGMLPWTYFSNTLTESANSITTNSGLITKVYFPRLVLPLSAAFSKLLDFTIAFILLVVILFVYEVGATWYFLLIPLLLLILFLTSLGFGIWLASFAVQYRDVKHALTFGTQLLMYLAPVVYPLSNIPDNYIWLYSLNPMVGVVEGFRVCLLSHQPFPWFTLLEGAVTSLLLFIFGLYSFRKMERKFADVA